MRFTSTAKHTHLSAIVGVGRCRSFRASEWSVSDVVDMVEIFKDVAVMASLATCCCSINGRPPTYRAGSWHSARNLLQTASLFSRRTQALRYRPYGLFHLPVPSGKLTGSTQRSVILDAFPVNDCACVPRLSAASSRPATPMAGGLQRSLVRGGTQHLLPEPSWQAVLRGEAGRAGRCVLQTVVPGALRARPNEPRERSVGVRGVERESEAATVQEWRCEVIR